MSYKIGDIVEVRAFDAWLRGRIVKIHPQGEHHGVLYDVQFSKGSTMCAEPASALRLVSVVDVVADA